MKFLEGNHKRSMA